jgi:cytidylate kinase
MKPRLISILTIIVSFFFLTGFVPILSFVGPGVTVLTSGNVYKASAQFIVNQRIEKETGKNSLTLIKETFINEEKDEKIKINSFDEDLRKLVETRIKMTKQKLDNQNLQKLLKKRIEVTRKILDLNNTTQ